MATFGHAWLTVLGQKLHPLRHGCSILKKKKTDVYFILLFVHRIVRKSDAPFGGIQLVVSGDFLQLPPVIKGPGKRKFCFQVLHIPLFLRPFIWLCIVIIATFGQLCIYEVGYGFKL